MDAHTPMTARYEEILSGLLDVQLLQQLELRFQPLLAIHGRPTLAVEALLRWCHPRLGWVSPQEFIQVAEQHGLMRTLTTWVIDASLLALGYWREQGIRVQLSLNVSAQDIESEYLIETLASALAHAGIEAGSITLEVTETMPLRCHHRAAKQVRLLRNLGFNVALDDFGSGYADIRQLAALPVNRVKIDRSLISVLDQAKPQAGLIQSLVNMVHELGLDVVAEGVESQQACTMLRECGCDYMQGFYISVPLTATEVLPWYRRKLKSAC